MFKEPLFELGDNCNPPVTGGGGGTGDITVYEKVVIYAEEAAALSNNSNEWSYGNGATGNIGITLLENWEIYGWTMSADVNTTGATVTIFLTNNINNQSTVVGSLGTASNNSNVANNSFNFTSLLTPPIPVSANTILGLRTSRVTGSISDARVALWLRRPVTYTIIVA